MLTLFKPHDDEAQPDFLGYVAHELADLLPMIDGVNFENLKVDIAKNGILEPILLFEDRILDGRNRYRAGKAVGHSFAAANFRMFDGTYAEAEAYVFSTNFLRRQMTNAQKQEVIRKMIEKYPDDSNRQIARRCGITSHRQRWRCQGENARAKSRSEEVRRILQDLGCIVRSAT